MFLHTFSVGFEYHLKSAKEQLCYILQIIHKKTLETVLFMSTISSNSIRSSQSSSHRNRLAFNSHRLFGKLYGSARYRVKPLCVVGTYILLSQGYNVTAVHPNIYRFTHQSKHPQVCFIQIG